MPQPPVVSFAESGLGSSALIENTDANASLEVKTTTGATHSASISVEVDSTANNLLDQKYRLATGVDNNNDFQIQTWYNDAWLTAFRVFPDSTVNFGPATSASLGGFRVKKTFWFDLAGTFAGVVTMSNDLLLEGVNVKDKLDQISAPYIITRTHANIPGGWGDNNNWYTIPSGYLNYEILIGGDSGMSFLSEHHLTLPVAVEGMKIKITAFCSKVNFRKDSNSTNSNELIMLKNTAGAWTSNGSTNFGCSWSVADFESNVIEILVTKQHNLEWFYFGFGGNLAPVTLPNI